MLKEDFSSRFTTEGCGERKFTIKIWGLTIPGGLVKRSKMGSAAMRWLDFLKWLVTNYNITQRIHVWYIC